MRSIIAGAAYFLIVFAVAFALGALRVTYLVPTLGVVLATLVELPLVLAASWVTCAWIDRHWCISSMPEAVIMGGSAFVFLMSAEAIGAIAIFGRTLGEHVGSYGTVAGVLGLAGQIAFGFVPVMHYLLDTSASGTDMDQMP